MRYLENAVTLEFDRSLCNGCGLCVQVCPHAVFKLVAKRAELADRGACMECGACATNCETKAIRVNAGVGCAAGLFASVFTRPGTKPVCKCSGDSSGCC